MKNNEYIPGVCNIGKEEIKRRKFIGYLGLITTIFILILFIIYDLQKIFRIMIFIPAFGSSMGFIQAHLHFCARFGLTSLFNFGELGNHDSVLQKEFRKQDKIKALKIIFYSLLIGLFFGITAVIV